MTEALAQDIRELCESAGGPAARAFAPGAGILAQRIMALLDRWESADG